QFGNLPRGSFGGLQGNIAGEALGHHHIDRSLADIIALDETVVVERCEIGGGFTDQAAGLFDLLLSLHLLDPDIEKTDRRSIDLEKSARPGTAHQGKVEKLLGIAT